MLYVFWGETFWINEKISQLLARAGEKGREIHKLDEDCQVPLNSFLGESLFGGKIFLVARDLLKVPERAREFTALARDLAESENIVVLAESELSEQWGDVFNKAGAKIQEFKKPSVSKLFSWFSQRSKELGLDLSQKSFNDLISETGEDPFAIKSKIERLYLEAKPLSSGSASSKTEPNYFNFADAASGKRRSQALSLLRSYVKDGFGAEEAFWKLWWKVKTLRLVASGKKGTGLHPFVEKKARQDLANYSKEELEKLSLSLADLFSGARRGEESFEEGLEKILIKL